MVTEGYQYPLEPTQSNQKMAILLRQYWKIEEK